MGVVVVKGVLEAGVNKCSQLWRDGCVYTQNMACSVMPCSVYKQNKRLPENPLREPTTTRGKLHSEFR